MTYCLTSTELFTKITDEENVFRYLLELERCLKLNSVSHCESSSVNYISLSVRYVHAN